MFSRILNLCNLIFFSWILSFEFDLFQMDYYLRIKLITKCQYNCYFFLEKTIFFSKKQLQIRNSGFVKTCDEYVPGFSLANLCLNIYQVVHLAILGFVLIDPGQNWFWFFAFLTAQQFGHSIVSYVQLQLPNLSNLGSEIWINKYH